MAKDRLMRGRPSTVAPPVCGGDSVCQIGQRCRIVAFSWIDIASSKMNGPAKLLRYTAKAARIITAPPRTTLHRFDDEPAPAALVGLSAVVPADMSEPYQGFLRQVQCFNPPNTREEASSHRPPPQFHRSQAGGLFCGCFAPAPRSTGSLLASIHSRHTTAACP